MNASTTPLVTWLLPVKNGMPFLPETLASIAAQTETRWEVLAWDNGSTDGTQEELLRWIPHRLPGRVVLNQPLPLGLCLAEMVRQCQTPWCARIDADDVNEPRRLETQLDYVVKHPQTVVCGTDVTFMDEAGAALPPQWQLPHTDAEVRWALRWHNALNHPTVLFDRQAILAAGNYRDRMPYEDYDLWLRVMAQGQMVNLAHPLVRYRIREAGVSRSVEQGRDIDAEAVASNATSLFEGLLAEEALRWRRKTMRSAPEPAGWSDLLRFRQIARACAAALKQPPGYFTATRLYRRQMAVLLWKSAFRKFR